MVEFFDAPPPMQEMIEEDFQEMTFEPVMIMEEMLMEEEMMIEEMPIEQMPMEEDVKPSFFAMTGPEQEEIYQETEELITEFLPPPPPTEEMPMEEEMVEEEPVMEEEMIEEEPKTMAAAPKEKEEVVEEKQEEVIEESKEEIIEESNEEEVKEEKPTSETPTKSAVQTKKIAKQKAIQQKKAIVKNLARVMEKVDKDIKNISKNLQIKNIIKMEAMTTDQVSLDKYQATSFYKPKDIYLDQLNLIDNRLIYADKSLATYIQNDKMDIKARKLQEIKSRKQQILMELEVLKNG
jgi:stress-induced morphogen